MSVINFIYYNSMYIIKGVKIFYLEIIRILFNDVKDNGIFSYLIVFWLES